MPFSGQFADAATPDGQRDPAVGEAERRDASRGKKLEFIRKDTGGIAPDVAKRLAQELVVRDGVDILAGFVLTPNAMAAGDVSQQAKKFMVVMNAATSIITTKSEYMVRTSLTTPQLNGAMGTWAVKKLGIKKVYSMVSDFGPGLDAEDRLHQGLQGGRRRGRRPGQVPGRQPGLLRLRAARQGPQPRGDLHLGARRRPARRDGQGAGRARHRRAQDQGARPARADRPQRDQGDGRRGARHDGVVALRRRARDAPRTRRSSPPTTPTTSAAPTTSRSAAGTACT